MAKNGKTIYRLNMHISYMHNAYMLIVFFWVKEFISGVYFCLRVVMTTMVVITMVVIGGTIGFSSSMGMLHF